MKKLLLLFSLVASVTYSQQTIYLTQSEYNVLKLSNSVDPLNKYVFTDTQMSQTIHYSGGTVKNGVCNCMVPLDSTFILAMQPNDDGSSGSINLPFTFDFYGNQYDSVIINNNGNVSFLAPYVTWTANPFPDASYNMIAPFWGDVDTRGTYVIDSLGNYIGTGDGGSVWYKVTPSALIVVWDHVGYFSNHTDLVSTFQLIISNGADSLVPAGNNVSFCYDDMQWTTGDASSGTGGFFGSPATVGVNVGNGVDFFQVGQFNESGVAFDGPYGNSDQVDFLDGQEIYFNIAGAAASNTPPVLISSAICDTIDVYTGDTLIKSLPEQFEFSISAYTPEMGQTLTTSIACTAPSAFTMTATQVSTEYYRYDCIFNANSLAPGLYYVNAQSIDNGAPAASSELNLVFRVNYEQGLSVSEISNIDFEVFPNPFSDIVQIQKGGDLNIIDVEVLDLSGKQVKTAKNCSSQLDLSDLQNGVYFISVYEAGKLIGTKRILKN
jgi:hypothetical protein